MHDCDKLLKPYEEGQVVSLIRMDSVITNSITGNSLRTCFTNRAPYQKRSLLKTV